MVAEAKKAAVDRVDEVEKKLNRMRLSAGVGDDELKLAREFAETKAKLNKTLKPGEELADDAEIGRASGRERACQYVEDTVGAGILKKQKRKNRQDKKPT